ncbi:aldolase catalytic domain-containing protein [Flavivirga amylovorans]|uniref:Aldolase catalytic domain-containing protein n=1 Tax=Flavivirga amylovorans TaxID=870486 RepID=A0ABT8X5N5_9FLAO|nr:aldolase catalytic domain-containing protein [Flavivirga amylovorans]MDO5989269.1 aldolase catalytic domain-containing protein [Flavivirga amylovorans]
MNNVKLLDCTLRDGGYYTNWDFDKALVTEYCKAMEALPINYVEVGYRSIPLDGYLGEYFYCPEYVMKFLKMLMPSKKLVIILDEKNIREEHIDALLKPCIPYISMVRMAIDPKNFKQAITLAKKVKKMGFEVAFNVMYMSRWKEDTSFLDLLDGIDDVIDYFYMVDSFGGVLPNDIIEVLSLVKSKTNVPIGFHGHNNLEMALINTLTAMDHGCSLVDATITGMGRGAGNLKTELLLTYLESINAFHVSFTELSSLVTEFEKLKKHYEWGTNLPYMVSGILSQPQKDVMSWISKQTYPISSIITALRNKSGSIMDNKKLANFDFSITCFKNVLIIGGGESAVHHKNAIKQFIKSYKDTCVIHASTKNAGYYKGLDIPQFFCLVGSEGYRMQKIFNSDLINQSYTCILPPYPRKMGTFIPKEVIESSYELESVNFTDKYKDSYFALALQISLEFKAANIYLAGYDGYGENLGTKELELSVENQYLIDKFEQMNLNLIAITDTRYSLKKRSIYSYLK